MIRFLSKENITSDIANDATSLFAQLSKRIGLPINELIENKDLFIAGYFENNKLIGMASMIVYKVISGYKGWIEDVVVDKNQRGKKIGEQLIEKLIEKGQELNLTEILVFTEIEKTPAIGLYQKVGFKDKGAVLFQKILNNPYPTE